MTFSSLQSALGMAGVVDAPAQKLAGHTGGFSNTLGHWALGLPFSHTQVQAAQAGLAKIIAAAKIRLLRMASV